MKNTSSKTQEIFQKACKKKEKNTKKITPRYIILKLLKTKDKHLQIRSVLVCSGCCKKYHKVTSIIYVRLTVLEATRQEDQGVRVCFAFCFLLNAMRDIYASCFSPSFQWCLTAWHSLDLAHHLDIHLYLHMAFFPGVPVSNSPF